ncbi:MAG TPA: TIGR02281 family clan AA aspartic protease [Usitatibacter sp.]|nr:TIGR02281 family clan AA aspartic protease [Usitatibacter sp.]
MRLHAFFAATILTSGGALATEVNVVGLFPGKALVSINNGAPRTLSVGDRTAEGVKLLLVTRNSADLEVDGVRQTLEMGQAYRSEGSGRQSVTLPQDASGHFLTDAMVNGSHMRFMVDTGATLVSIPLADAVRLGIDYEKGQLGYSMLADGRKVPSWRIVLDSVQVGDVTLTNVEGSVNQGVGIPLLGMSFLNRTEMRREGSSLTLTKRY